MMFAALHGSGRHTHIAEARCDAPARRLKLSLMFRTPDLAMVNRKRAFLPKGNHPELAISQLARKKRHAKFRSKP